jgi:L,D-peptidoglycan transpeptidase YkuD (ErfK/YbiS/YcfS/YnhG family)
VLIGSTRSRNRPATAFRRRSFLFGGLVLTLAASVTARHWDSQPAGAKLSIDACRHSAQSALRVLRAPAPAAAQLVDDLVATAEVVTADEATAPPWERYPGRTEAAWGRVQLEAHRAVAIVGRRTRDLSGRWRVTAPSVGLSVKAALEEAKESGVGGREVSAAKQAEWRWKLAERYAAQGFHDRALVEAEQAKSLAAVVHSGFLAVHERFSDRKNLSTWRAMVSETIAASRASGDTVIVVDKLKRRLFLYAAGRRVGTYAAELGGNGLLRKMHAGDQATPEGQYRVAQAKGEGRSKFYKALLIDYPNAADRARFAWGKKIGAVPSRASIGSLIEIHGGGGQGRDWTDGCIALANADMDQVFARARVGTLVTIVGTF